MTEAYTDPKDTPVYLQRNGWTTVDIDVSGTIWYGEYEGDSKSMIGVLRRTPGGRRKFYVRDPPEEFVSAAHDGRCLSTARDDFTEQFGDVSSVHFREKPDSFGDGIELIESHLD